MLILISHQCDFFFQNLFQEITQMKGYIQQGTHLTLNYEKC